MTLTPSCCRLAAALIAGMLCVPGVATALVDGEPHAEWRRHRLQGGAVVTGNSLMTASIAAPEVNSGLLPQSDGDVSGLPFDAEIVGAYLFWSGSIRARTDRQVRLTVADGTTFRNVAAETCFTTPSLGGFFYCRADVTDEVAAHPGPMAFNGTYTVGDLDAEPGLLNDQGDCIDEQECQAKYAGWSLVLVYEADSANTLRDVFVYDGFRQLDEDFRSPGVDQFTIDGFDMPRNGRARLSYFALEGDFFLGVPPQDTDPVAPCDTCYDFLAFNGQKLSDATNPPNNLFNSTSPGGVTIGLDLDTFDVSDLLAEGQRRAEVRVGSGDGLVDIGRPDPGGGGESFFLGYVLLTVDRNAPNFLRDGTQLTVFPDEAAPLERVVIEIEVENEGTLDSLGTEVVLQLPEGLRYVAGSLRVDGADPVPGDEAQNPLAAGLSLGRIPFQGDNTRSIQLRAQIEPDVPPGTELQLRGVITANNLDVDAETNVATVTVLGGVALPAPQKTVVDVGGDGVYAPGELIRYQITITNPTEQLVGNATVRDPLPQFVDLLDVIPTSGVNQSAGRQVVVEEMQVPPNGMAAVTILARVRTAEQLVADGVDPEALNGLVISNQAVLLSGGEQQVSDDPTVAGAANPTVFTLSAAVDVSNPDTRKRGVDVDGGLLEPGDVIRYTIDVTNRGSAPASVFINDVFPAVLGACALESAQPGIVCGAERLQGLLQVGPGETETITFTLTVAADAPHDTVVQNVATGQAQGEPADQFEVRSDPLRVVAAPDFPNAGKSVAVVGGGGATVVPGDRLLYTLTFPNEGNRAATAVTVTDTLSFDGFTDVVPLDGGAYDPGTRTLTWNLPDLPAGETATVRFEAQLPAMLADGTTIDNVGEIAVAQLVAPVPTPVARVVVRSEPRLTLSKAVDGGRTYRPGQPVAYVLTLTNTGTDIAEQVVVQDTFSDAFESVASPDGAEVDGTVSWTAMEVPALAALAPGESVVLRATATLRPALFDGTMVANQANTAATNADPGVSDDPDTPVADDATVIDIESEAILALTKQVVDLNGGDVQPGDRVRYDFTVINTGDAPSAPGSVVSDAVPALLTDVSPGVGGALAGGQLTFAIEPPVVAGEPAVFSVEATISPDARPGARIINQAVLQQPGAADQFSDDPTRPGPEDATIVTVVSRPDLTTSTKRVEPSGEVESGAPLTYTIDVVNSGTAAAENVVVEDALPAELVDAVAPGAMLAGGVATWNVGALAPGESRTLTVSGTALRPIADGTEIRNQAVVRADGLADAPTDDPDTADEDDATVLVVRARPDLSASTKVAVDLDGAPLRPGDTLEYRLTFRNGGAATAQDVTVTDTLDRNLELLDAGGAQVAGDPPTLTWSLPELAVDEAEERVVRVRVVDPLANGTPIANQAVLSAANIDGDIGTDDPATAPPNDPTVVQIISAADLSTSTKAVELVDGDAFRPGARVRYTLVFTNTGSDAATNAVIRDVLPVELVEVRPGDGGVLGDGAIEWRVDRIEPMASTTVRFEATLRTPIADGALVANQAEITADGFAAPFATDDPSTAALDDPTTFRVESSRSLALTKTVEGPRPGQIRPGDTVRYTLRLEDAGDAPAGPVPVEDAVPAPLTDVRVEPADAAQVVDGVVAWAAEVGPGLPAELVVVATVPADTPDGTVVRNVAVARDGDVAVEGEVTFTVEDRADLSTSTKTVAGSFEPFGEITYTLAIQNTGGQTAADVVVVDPLPDGLDLIDTNPPADVNGRELVWRLGDLDAGAREVLTVRAQVGKALADGDTVVNTAGVRADGVDETVLQAEFDVTSRAELVLGKTVRDDNGGDYAPGDPITYLLEITNEGNRAARDLQVLDPVDPRLVQVNAVDGELANGLALWNLDSVPAGETVVLELRARLRDDLSDGDVVSNQFAVQAGDALQESEIVELRVRFGALAGSTKSVRPIGSDSFVSGGQVEYIINVVNPTESAVEAVTVVDPVDLDLFGGIEPDDGGFFDPRAGTIEWNPQRTPALQQIPPGGRVRLTFQATLRPGIEGGTVVPNQAEIFVRGEAEPVLSDDPSLPGAADPTVFTVVGAPVLEMTKDIVSPADRLVRSGDLVTWEIRVQNVGDEPALDTLLTDNLDGRLIYVPGSTVVDGRPIDDNGQFPLERGIRIGDDGRIESGQLVTVRFTTRAPDASDGLALQNQAIVFDATGRRELSDDPDTEDVDDDPTRFRIGGGADLSLRKAFEVIDGVQADRALVGETIEWRITVVNNGLEAARQVVLTDRVPARTTYVEGSVVVDGVPQSDAPGDDLGQVVRGSVTVIIPEVPPRRSVDVRFRTVVEAPPDVRNRAVAEAENAPDASSEEIIVPVGELPTRSLEITKTVVDPTGEPALAGERLRYTIRVRNTGTVDLADIAVADEIPAGIIFLDAVSVPPGTRASVDEAPAGAFQNGRVQIDKIAVAAGGEARIVLDVQVDPRLDGERRICNVAIAASPDVPPVETDPLGACVTAQQSFASVRGTVFQDLDDDGEFGEADVPFDGMRVALYPATDPDGDAAGESDTETGGYGVDRLLPGSYRVRVFSENDVLLLQQDDVEFGPGEAKDLDLLIDPSGRVYDSQSGDLLDGAQVFIYRDGDSADDDVLDEESRQSRVLVDPADLEAPSQQGQRTAHGGLYQFAVRVPGRYIVEVVPPGPTYQSPSILVPPLSGVARTDDPEGRVVEDDLPSVEPDADRTYFLGFDLLGPDDFFQNNHIPVDPLSSLIQISKRTLKPVATTGDVVTYEVDVVNGSNVDLVFDEATRTGGVILQDTIPNGFKYIAGSTVVTRIEGATEVPLFSDDPDGVRILRFGRARTEDGNEVLRPMDLAAGQALRIRYQLVVGANAKPEKTYTNRAVLLADGSVPVSRTARADVRVKNDPIFDQGLLLGKVWCDDDGDGKQSEGERGLPGARIYMDHGWYAITDDFGRYHLKDIDPGSHAIKIDTDTLLPGAEMTTDELRVVHFTRGLPAKVDFGVTCPSETAANPRLELAGAGSRAALDALAEQYVVVIGNVNAPRMRVRDKAIFIPDVGVELLADGSSAYAQDLPAGVDGAANELAFVPRLGEGAPSRSWAISVGPLGGEEVVVLDGEGPPPDLIAWDQRGPDGAYLLEKGNVYTWRLAVTGPDGQLVGSPAGIFGVGASGRGEASLVAAVRGDEAAAEKALTALADEVKALPGSIVVEGHGSDPTARAETQAAAEAAVARLVELTGLPPERFEAVGMGSDAPLVPNISERNRRRNQRVEVRHRAPDAEDAGGKRVDVRPRFAPVARVGADEAVPDGRGDFAMTARIPADGVVEVLMRAPDGRRSVTPVRVRAAKGEPAEARRRVTVSGSLPDALTVDGGAVDLSKLPLARVAGPEQAPLTEEGRLTGPVDFKLSGRGKVLSWRFEVEGPTRDIVFARAGEGRPPSTITWAEDGEGDTLRPGYYRARFIIRSRGSAVAWSAPAVVQLGDSALGPRGGAQAWALRLDGQPVEIDDKGGLYLPADLRVGEALWAELGRPDGSRAAFFVVPPANKGEPALVVLPGADAPAPGGVRVPGASSTDTPALAQDGAAGAADTPEGEDADATSLGLQAYVPAAAQGAGTDPKKSPAPEERTPLPETARAELAKFGEKPLLATVPPPETADGVDVPAARLAVELPPEGATLPAPTLPVRGTTAPGNRVFLNGAEIEVDENGEFSGTAAISPESGALEVKAVDDQGNTGVIARQFAVAEDQWFILAMGEGLAGSVGTELDGVHEHTSVTLGDTVYLHGRAAVYLKGRVKGDKLLDGFFRKYEITGHLDTARRDEFEAYFEQIIDPEEYYPVYGDDGTEVKDVNTRGPLYVAIRADESTLTVGNYKTGIRGLELFRYDRALYGAHVHFDKKTGDIHHDVTAFVADDDRAERHAYTELRGTGGSLYYLPHEYLVEGSEQVYLVERDRITGVERRRVALARDIDYTIRYREGRVLMKRPVPSVTLDAFGALPPGGSGEVLDGHPVFLSVEYDHTDPTGFGEVAAGAHAKETWHADEKTRVVVGGGYVEEGRGSLAGAGIPDYKLWGAQLGVHHGRRSRVEAELARSQSINGDNLYSDDGGLTFQPFNLRDGTEQRGTSFLLRSGFEIDDFAGEGKRDHWYSEGYWQYIAPGFYSGGTIQQQGLEKYGGLSRYHINEHHIVRIQHDGMVSETPATQGTFVYQGFRREVTRAGYTFVDTRLKLDTEIVHTQEDVGEGPTLVTDVLAVNGRYQLNERWALLGEQEIVVKGDSRIHEETGDLLTTTAGAEYRINQTFRLEALESVRWSGDNATQIGLLAEINDRHTVYTRERIANEDGQTRTTTVVGGEERWGEDKSGRAYGEYQLETDNFGPRNRAVLGMGKRSKIVKGLHMDVGYERSQVTGASPTGEFSRDAVAAGVDWAPLKKLKLSARWELRYEDNDEDFTGMQRRDRMQVLGLHAIDFRLTRDLTLGFKTDYSHTLDLELEGTEAELLQGSVGLAWRPVRYNWVALITKYSKRYEQRPIDVALEQPTREETDVIAVIPIFELPYDFQIVEKVALKRLAVKAPELPAVVSNSVLWINRVNYHLTNTWDAGVEYRILRVSLAPNTRHGALAELNYIVQNTVRIGVGYNFTSFSDDEFARLDEDHGGPFFRVIGQY